MKPPSRSPHETCPPGPDFGFHLLSRGRAPFLGFTCPPEQLTKPETLPLLEDAERKDEHDANLTTRRGPGEGGWAPGTLELQEGGSARHP